MRQGEVYRCPVCEAEVSVTRASGNPSQSDDSPPICGCGEEMELKEKSRV
jgi:hypothetical protein